MLYSLQGKKPQIHPTVFVAPSSDIIGDVKIGARSSVWFQVVIRGDVNSITIGDDTNIQDGSILHVTYKKYSLRLGNGVTVGHSVTLHGCDIEDYCLIGMRAVVMDGARIEKECFIGAGALVTQNMHIPSRSLVLGSPAKIVRSLNNDEIKFLYQSAENYKNYMQWYQKEQSFERLATSYDQE